MKKIADKTKYFALMSWLFLLNAKITYAGSLESSKLVTGTKKLFEDASKVIMLLAPVLGGVMAGWQLLMMQSAEDEQDIRTRKKKIKIVITATIGVFLISTMLNLLIGYFK